MNKSKVITQINDGLQSFEPKRHLPVVAMVVLGLVLCVQICWPVSVEKLDSSLADSTAPVSQNHLLNLNIEPVSAIRPEVFKSVSPLKKKPKGNIAANKVLQGLDLQCVLTDATNEPAAYLQIKGKGLTICHVGDTIDDQFQILDIRVTDQCMEIMVAGQVETLRP